MRPPRPSIPELHWKFFRAFDKYVLVCLLSLVLGMVPIRHVLAAPFLLIQGHLRILPGNLYPASPLIRLHVTARPNEVLETGSAAVTYTPGNGFYTVDLSYLSTWNSSEFVIVEAFDPLTGASVQSAPELIDNHDNNELIDLDMGLPPATLLNRVGDANVDGHVNLLDAGVVQRRLYGLLSGSSLGPGALANGDTAVDLSDLVLIAQKAVGVRTGLTGPGGSSATILFSGIPSFLTAASPPQDIVFNVLSAWGSTAGKVNGLAATFTAWPASGGVAVMTAEDRVASAKVQAPTTASPPVTPGNAIVTTNINIMNSEGTALAMSAGWTQSVPVYGQVCGDGIVVAGESCEDGNTVGGDGCSAACRVENGYCGDGVLNTGEVCDDVILGPCMGTCNDSCNALFTDVCGNAVTDCHEACEDGNLVDGDGCSSGCEIEPAPFPYVEDFESPLAAYWTLTTAAPASAELAFGDQVTGIRALRLGSSTGAPATGRADLMINLDGQTQVNLRVGHRTLSPIGTEMPSIFSGTPDGDGIAISPDGVTWRKLAGLALTEAGASQWSVHVYDLDQAVLDAGWAYTDRFRIRFQHTAYDLHPNDGGLFDWLVISSATCGNGMLEAPENCDDGDNSGCTTACDPFCSGSHVVACGDGFAECGEACDDGDMDDCTPACDAFCAGPYPLVCGDGIPECAEQCDDGNLIDDDGCSSSCQIECTPDICPSSADQEQWAGSETQWPGGHNPGTWTGAGGGNFNGGLARINSTSTAVYTGYFATQSTLKTFFIWVLAYRHTTAGQDRSIAVRIDGSPVGTWVGTPVAVATIQWQMVGSVTLAAGAHVMELQGTTAITKWFDGYAITTNPSLNPQTQWTPLTTYNLDNPVLDLFIPGAPDPTCCGDCVLQGGEVCDDGVDNGAGPGYCLANCSGSAP